MNSPWGTRLQVSLRSLFVGVLLIAVGCAALSHPTKAWLLTVVALSMLLFLIASVRLIIERGPRQTFAIGFLLCGALHAIFFLGVEVEPTKALLEEAYYQFGRPEVAASTTMGRLQRGEEGDAVKALQTALNEHLPKGKQVQVDGDFGGGTRVAVEAFQKLKGHQVDGIVSVMTWRELGPEGRRALQMYGLPTSVTKSLTADYFIQIGGWLVTLAVASMGGHLASSAHAQRLKASSEKSRAMTSLD